MPDLTQCKQSVTVFRVGSERAYLPEQFKRVDLMAGFRFDASDWYTIDFFAREVVRLNERSALPLEQGAISTIGYRNTQIRAFVAIDGEETLVGIGAGCRFSLPAASSLSLGVAIPIVPQGLYPYTGTFPNFQGSIVNFDSAAVTSPPFEMPSSGLPGEPDPLPVYDTYITVFVKGCRPPVGDRLARLSQQAFLMREAAPPPEA